jgi:hypothetical protein
MHAFRAAVLLRMTRLDAFNANPQPEPPDRELAQVEQGLAGSERRSVIYVSGRSHTADSDADGIFAYHSSGGSKELDGCRMARTRSESSIPCN